MPFERGSRGIKVLHYGRKDERRHKGDTQRIGYSAVVFFETVLVNVQFELLIKVFEEYSPHVVALIYNNGVLL